MNIYLRPVELKDGPSIVKWRNNKNVKAHCMTRRDVTIESNIEFFHNYVETGKYKQFIVEKTDDYCSAVIYHIATIYLKDIDLDNKRCELCIFTSDDEEWNSESQIIAVRMLLDKAFNEYDIHKVYSYVFTKFPDEIELLEKSGFTQEAILKSEAVNEYGQAEDIIRMCIFNKSRL